MSLHDAARRYLAAGLCVLAAHRDEKRPTVSWKPYQTRLPTESEVDAWLANGPSALCLLAGRTSGHLETIDFDLRAELYEAWARRVEQAAPGLAARLVISQTQSGGRHVTYRCPSGISGNLKLAQRRIDVESSEPVVLCGKTYIPRQDANGQRHIVVTLIETRGEGGIFLCDPTPGYRVTQGDLCDPPVVSDGERDILLGCAWELNEYLPQVVDGPRVSAENADNGGLSADNSHSGPLPAEKSHSGAVSAHNAERPGDDFNSRGDVRAVLTQHGWALARGGENEYWRRPGKTCGWSATLKDRVFYVFTSNAPPLEPNRPYSPFSVYAMLNQGGDFAQAARELRELGYGADPSDHGVDISHLVAMSAENTTSPPENADVPDPGPFPADLLDDLPAIVQEAMDYYMANAIEAQPVMFLASFLAAAGTVLGHKVKDSSGLRTNVYTVGVLGTGGGKEATRETVDRIFQRAGLAPMCGAEEFASDAGLVKAVSVQNPILFQIDEFGRLMHSIQIGARHSPHLYNIASVLLKLYSKANGTFRSKAYADARRNMRIEYPHVCVYGTTVLGNFWDSLNTEAIKDGFLPRLMIFESPGDGIEGQGVETDPPAELLEFFNYWAGRRITGGNMERVYPSPMAVPYSPEAAAVMEEFRTEQKREMQRHDELGPLWSRARENAGKLALIHACWKNSEQPVVETDSALWAVRLTRHLIRQTLWRASQSLVDNPFHALCQKALEKLRKAPGGELDHSTLLKRMKMKAKDFRDLMQTLQQRGDVDATGKSTSGRPGLFYQLRSRRHGG